jgi:hypothetical protein
VVQLMEQICCETKISVAELVEQWQYSGYHSEDSWLEFAKYCAKANETYYLVRVRLLSLDILQI